jgi:hypothetical protein
MDSLLAASPVWRQVAIVEISDSTEVDFLQLVRDDRARFRAERAAEAPAGFEWYKIVVDVNGGDSKIAQTAWIVLTAIKKSADEGILKDFRIIQGQHWLVLGEPNARVVMDGAMVGGVS